ncbi:MAG TPA: 4-hydroxy-3-methylbut-2-enyl diphosphate reductase [Bacteroidales bacterium]|nr:4-hydroxy-3-methylbut-2-enyl diphosphate reductase [Bacteroidales bacterium]
MIVETDTRSGFCFGVRNAVDIAEKALLNGERVYSLGPIVHNDKEVERLASLGLISIDYDQYRQLRDCKVLIRAHGEPPETYNTAEENNIEIIEATCPIVKKLQSRIKQAWLKIKENDGQVVIFGKEKHAEVIGLQGQINNEAIVVSNPADISKINISKPVYIFAQTTMSHYDYGNLCKIIRSGMSSAGINPDENLVVHRTICGQVSNREPQLKQFAARHDVIIFVSGRESSNGKMLYSVCKSVNPDTWFISSPDELDPAWFKGKKSAGICGATSTPGWLIKETEEKIKSLCL